MIQDPPVVGWWRQPRPQDLTQPPEGGGSVSDPNPRGVGGGRGGGEAGQVFVSGLGGIS